MRRSLLLCAAGFSTSHLSMSDKVDLDISSSDGWKMFTWLWTAPLNCAWWSWHRQSLRTSKKTTPSLRECGDTFAIQFQQSESRFHCRLWKFLD